MTSDPVEQSSRRHRWSWQVVAAGILVVALVLGYHILLAQLDQPYFKRVLNSSLSLTQGIEIDYQRLELAPLSGRLRIEGLKIGSPEPYRHHVPSLLEVDRLSMQWSTGSLFKKEIRIEHIEVTNVRVYDVLREQGPSTWGLLGRHPPSEPTVHDPSEPLSKAAQLTWLPRAVRLDALSVADLSFIRTELAANGRPRRQLELRGLRLAADALLIPGKAAARATLKSFADDVPTRLTIRDRDSRASSLADVQVAVMVNLSDSRAVEFSAVADLLAQTFDPSLGLSGRVVDVEGVAEFAADAETTRLVVKRFDVLQGVLSAQFTAALSDYAPLPKIVGSGRAHLDPLLTITTGWFPELDGQGLYVNGRFTTASDDERVINVEVTAQAGEVRWRQPDGPSLAMEQVAFELRGVVNPEKGGSVSVGVPVNHVTYRDSNGRTILVEELMVKLESQGWSFDAQTPSSAAGTIRSASVLVGENEQPLKRIVEQIQLQWMLDGATRQGSPLPVSGRLNIDGVIDELAISANGRLQDDEAQADVVVKGNKLAGLAQWLPELKAQGISLQHTGLEASVRGRYRHLGQADKLELGHTVAAHLTRLHMRRPGLVVHSPAVELHARHDSIGGFQSVTAEIDLGRATINGVTVGTHPRITASARHTKAGMSAQAAFGMDPVVAVSLQGDFEATSGRVTHRALITLDHARMLRKWLPKPVQEQYPIDWSNVAAALELKGRIDGLLVMRGEHNMPEMTDRPLTSLAAEQSLVLDIHHVTVHDESTVLDLPHARLQAAGSQRAGRLTVSADVATPQVKIVHHGEDVRLDAISQHVEVSADSTHLADGDIDIRMAGAVKHVSQNYAPFYPISDVTISGRAHINRLETFILDDLTFQNKGGGTHINVSKSLNRAGAASSTGPPRQSLRELTLSGRLMQSLQKLSKPAGGFQGRGVITAPLTVYSSDGSLFNIAASVHMDDVGLTIPESGLHVEGLSGRIHLDETVEWDSDDGISVVHDSERNHFSSNRYQDTQPFLANQSFFKIGTLRWHDRRMGPIIGSMHVKNNVFSLNKLKIQKEQGIITGQLIFDYYPGAEQVKFHGNVTGVRFGKSQEPLDGNMAFAFVPSKLELDGRIQILRLSRQHLEDMLDLLDPFREDGGLNRLRFALAFGYPNFVRMDMSQGLAALRVELAGLGKLLTIDEIRGIALGPFMSRHVEPLLKTWWPDPDDRDAIATATERSTPVH